MRACWSTLLPRTIIGVKLAGRFTPCQMAPSSGIARANSASSAGEIDRPASDVPGALIGSPPGRSRFVTTTRFVTAPPLSLCVFAKSVIGLSRKLATKVTTWL